MRIPFGEWLPDLPAVGHQQLRTCLNVLARDGVSYAPFPSLQTSFSALPSRVTGAFAARQQDGLIRLFAGTQTKLFQTLTGPSWEDVTNVGGDYVSLTNPWKFEQLDFRVLATNYKDPIQTWLLGTDTAFSDLSVDAPNARYLANWFPGFIAAGYTNDPTDGERPNRVWWHAFGDPTSWPTPGSSAAEAVQSDFRDLSKGGLITGMTGPVGGAAGSVFTQTAIYRVDYEGPPTTFRILDVETDRGTNAPQSIVSIGNTVYYLDNDGFYAFDGANSIPIGSQRVDRTFWKIVDQGFLDRIYGVADPINKIVMWLYPTANSGGMPDRIIAYNWETGRWSEAETFADILVQFFTPSYTIDNIDSFGDIDTILPTLDARAWLGGTQSLVAFDRDHKMAFFTGESLEATLEIGDYTPENGRKVEGLRAHPYVDGGTVTARAGYSDTQTPDDSAINYTNYVPAERDGTHIVRGRGRYARVGVKIAAGGGWSHANGVDVTTKDGGI